VRRIALVALVLLLMGGGPTEPEIPNCDFVPPDDYEGCIAYVEELLMEQQQEQIALPPNFATPNQPTTIILDQGGSPIAEWAALITGIAALLGALEALRRRRHRRDGA
jgi:hypothetical protein